MHSISRGLVLASFASLLFACGASSNDSAAARDPAGSTVVHVDASTIAALPVDSLYDVDLSKAHAVYEFDYAATPIDFSRVQLHFDGTTSFLMSDWLAMNARDGLDDVATHPGSLQVRVPSLVGTSSGSVQLDVTPNECQDYCIDLCGLDDHCSHECFQHCIGTSSSGSSSSESSSSGGHLPI